MRKFWGPILILCCLLCSKGLIAVWEAIKTTVLTVCEMIKAGFALLLKFSGELGLSDWLAVRGIYIAVAAWAFIVAGYVFSRKEKKRVIGVISSVVGFVTAVLAFA